MYIEKFKTHIRGSLTQMTKTLAKIFLSVVLSLAAGQANADSPLQFSTFYPAPYGMYDRLRLIPRPALGTPCDPGTFYIRQDNGQIQFCKNDNTWGTIGTGYWTRAGNSLYPTDTNNLTGIGTTTVPVACCGNGSCEPGNGENCSTCGADCGGCPCSGYFSWVGGFQCCVGNPPFECNEGSKDGDAYCIDQYAPGDCSGNGNPYCVAADQGGDMYACVNTGPPAPACGPQTSPEFRLTIANDGGIMAKGTFTQGDPLITSGAGTRLIWYPKKAAFRAVHDTLGWSDDNKIGNYSMGMGYNPKAQGVASVAMGYQANATGDYAAAMGYMTTASKNSSIALGNLTSAGVANNTTAMGDQTTASGLYATAMGKLTTASGTSTVAMGLSTTAQAYASLVIGQCNVIAGNPNSWVQSPTADPVFVIGNGAWASGACTSTSNALTVLKNGKTGIATDDPVFRLTLDKGATTPDGGIIAIGTFGSGAIVGTAGDLSAGTYLIWYPRRGAFRAGGTGNLEWDDSPANLNIGNYSVGIGLNPWAKGNYSVATGHNTIAKGDYSVAMGDGANTGTGGGSGGNVALGYQATAAEANSTALGDSTEARGTYSLAINNRTKVDRTHDARDLDGSSTQIGGTAMGFYTVATSYLSTVIGQYNVIPTAHQKIWSSTDPLFVIGNGNGIFGDPNRWSNAWTVLKNGNTTIGGVTTASGGLIIDTIGGGGELPPASPVNGQLILCTDTGDATLCNGN